MLTRIGELARRWAARTSPWTNVYGLARSVLALATLLTLVCSETTTLFRPGAGRPDYPTCSGGLSAYGWFCLPFELPVLEWAAIVALIVIASGWRPRVTAMLHWWIATSYHLNATLVDGGDQVNQILTLLIVPVALTDPRQWHWQAPPERSHSDVFRRLIAGTTMTVIQIQVAGIYFHAAIGKFAVQQWTNGTALYYWLQDGVYGAPDWIRPLLVPLLEHGTTVALMTWGVMLLEHLLGVALLLRAELRRPLLCAGVALHLGILAVQGIASFSLAMMAALLVYLHPWSRPLVLPIPALVLQPQPQGTILDVHP